MDSNTPTIRNVTRWIGSMRSIGTRPLDEETIERLTAYFDGIRRKRHLSLAVAALGFLCVATACTVFSNAPEGKEPDWLLPLAVIGAMVMAVALTYQKRYGEWLRNGKKQLQLEDIEVFQNEDGRSVEILTLSHEIISIDGIPQPGLGYIDVEFTADAPRSTSDPHFPSRLGETSTMGIGKHRVLTEEELWELRVYQRRELTPGIRQVTPLVTFFGLGPLLIGIFDSDRPFFWIGLALCSLAALGWWKLAQEVASHRRISQDLLGGTVRQIDPSEDPKLAARIEVLPNSQLVWRQGENPAGWRRVA